MRTVTVKLRSSEHPARFVNVDSVDITSGIYSLTIVKEGEEESQVIKSYNRFPLDVIEWVEETL